MGVRKYGFIDAIWEECLMTARIKLGNENTKLFSSIQTQTKAADGHLQPRLLSGGFYKMALWWILIDQNKDLITQRCGVHF